MCMYIRMNVCMYAACSAKHAAHYNLGYSSGLRWNSWQNLISAMLVCESEVVLIFDPPFSADIDECLVGIDGCINSQCVNSPGSYACVCLDGFAHSNMSNPQSPCGTYIARAMAC